MSASRRSYPPAACAFNPTCTVALVSTIAGVRPFELLDAADTAASGGPVAQSLLPPPPSRNTESGGAASEAAAATPQPSSSPYPSHALWETPVYVATVAGESALVAVVFRARPPVFTPSTHSFSGPTHTQAEQQRRGSAAPPSPSNFSSTAAAEEEAGEEVWTAAAAALPSPAAATKATRELFAAEAEYRRYVYLFDATTGVCLAALHFWGSPITALRANAAVLLAAAVDLFHVVELDTLRYVRQQSMYKPQNPRSVLELSSAIPVRPRKSAAAAAAAGASSPSAPPSTAPQYTYAVAFPQSARGYPGDVTVLTMHTTTAATTAADPTMSGAAAATSSATTAPPQASSVQQRTIPAHHHAVAHLCLRRDGRLLVTASQLGTTLKVFDCLSGVLLVELQRGHRPAAVLSLAVEHEAHRVAALSTNGTLHVFNCAAVVQSWEAGRRWAAGPSNSAAATAAASKVRAEWKWKVPSLHAADTPEHPGKGQRTGSTGSPMPADNSGGGVAAVGTRSLPGDGAVQHAVGFAADGRTVWVAQVESTDTQASVAGAFGSTADVRCSSGVERRCIGRLTRFPVLPSSRVGAATAAAERVGGVSFSIDV